MRYLNYKKYLGFEVEKDLVEEGSIEDTKKNTKGLLDIMFYKNPELKVGKENNQT